MRPRRLQSVLSAIYNIIAAFPWPLFIDILVNVVLVANKVDLAPQREVSTQEGQHLAQRWGCAFFDTSAKTGTNVDEVPATHPRTHCAHLLRPLNWQYVRACVGVCNCPGIL